MNIQLLYRIIQPIFRANRTRLFIRWLAPTEQTRILDVGGRPWDWGNFPVRAKLTILNLDAIPDLAEQNGGRHEIVTGDGTNLPYPDGTFDIIFSNSVIEHLGTFERQRKFAEEARRVGRHLWVQTPARSFFMEPHLIAPFVHWLPRGVRKKILRYGTPWGWITKPTKDDVDDFINEVRLLNYSEMKSLFPDCHIHKERILGLTKSYVAVRAEGGTNYSK
jgi:hypothetical protein